MSTGEQSRPEQPEQLVRVVAEAFDRLDMPGRLSEAMALHDRLTPLAAARPVAAARLGGHGRNGRHGRPGGLTERELEVAGLVAQALTNQDIADRLVLSVRRVESHVRSALAKLGLVSRTELAVWLQRLGQDPHRSWPPRDVVD